MSKKKDSLEISNKMYYDILSKEKHLKKKQERSQKSFFQENHALNLSKENKRKGGRGRPGRKKKIVKSESEEDKDEESPSPSKKQPGRKRADKDERKHRSESEGEDDEGDDESSEPQPTTKKAKSKPATTKKPIDSTRKHREKESDKVKLPEKEVSSEAPKPRGRPSKNKTKGKKVPKKVVKDSDSDEEDKEMEDVSEDKPKVTKKKEAKPEPLTKESKTAKIRKSGEADMEVEKSVTKKSVSKPSSVRDEEEKSNLGKRTIETRTDKSSEVKRKKTEKGERGISSEKNKRKIRHMEWQYGRHCSRDLWIGKKVKVKLPAKSKDNSTEYRFGKLLEIKENDKGEKVLFHIAWSHDKKKTKEWIDINENRTYIFGQILFLKHPHDVDQIEFIKKTYGWKGKEKKGVPIPVVELIDANDPSKKITPHEDPNEKIPIQYFTIEKAKKIKQEVLYDYREFKDESLEFIRDNVKNGEKLYSKITSYKKHYDQWIEKYGKIEVDMSQSLKNYTAKIVRVYKGERNCGKAVVLRVLNEEGRNEIVYIRYLKNSKAEWLDTSNDSENSKDANVTFKLDRIKGVITYDSLRESIVPKSRMVLPYEFDEKDQNLQILKEEDWKVGMPCYSEGITKSTGSKVEDI